MGNALFNKRYAVTKWLAVICAILVPGMLIYSGPEVFLPQSHPVGFSYAFTPMMYLSALIFFALMLASTRITLPQQRRMSQWQFLKLILNGVGKPRLITRPGDSSVAGNVIFGTLLRHRPVDVLVHFPST
ncbi:hypothetical protein N5C84_19310 [Klebsiella pneumoniae]|nr:hypothetical protein [Klebsiella pneumoniae]